MTYRDMQKQFKEVETGLKRQAKLMGTPKGLIKLQKQYAKDLKIQARLDKLDKVRRWCGDTPARVIASCFLLGLIFISLVISWTLYLGPLFHIFVMWFIGLFL